ncbi:hypothetical protein ACFL04_01920 [Patescibacteria group bacterium]
MSGLNDLTLKISYWFVSHRQQFRRWWFVTLVAFDFLLMVYVIIVLALFINEFEIINHQIGSMPRTVVSALYKADHRPADLIIDQPQLLSRGDERTDLAVRVDNTNDDWAAAIDFTYKNGDELITASTSYVGPNTTAYLLGLNVSLPENTRADQVDLFADNIKWIYIPSQSDYVTPSFLVSETKKVETTSDNLPSTVVASLIKNNAVVGWREVVVQVVITVGDKIEGVDKFTIRDWLSLTERDITVQWRRSFSPVAQVNILPIINPFDRNLTIR